MIGADYGGVFSVALAASGATPNLRDPLAGLDLLTGLPESGVALSAGRESSDPGSPHCAVCGGGAFEPALGELARCRTCGHLQYFVGASVTPADFYTDEYFNGLEYSGYLDHQAPSLRRSMRRHLAQMARYGPLRDNLLEIGCAYGLFLDEARPFFSSLVGVDVCEGPVDVGRRTFDLDLRCGDFVAMDLPPESFDTICLWDTIEHLPNPREFVDAARRLLKPDGHFYLTTGDAGSLMARVRGRRWRQIHPPSHLQYFSRRTIVELLRRCRFEVIGIETAAYHHTVYDILASVRLRGGLPATLTDLGLGPFGAITRRLGSWIDLGDIMFVAARPG